MYQNNRLIVCAVGMRVILGRFTVCRPAGMADTAGAEHTSSVIRLFCQYIEPSFCLDDRDVP